MPGIIDTLVLEFGLDPAKFTTGQKAAVESIKKTEDQALRSAKNIEEHGRRAAEFFSQLRNQVIGLYAAFTAGRGLKEFVADITHSDAAVGYLAKKLDMSVGDIAKMGGALRSVGGDLDDASSFFQTLTNDMQQLMITGNSQFLPYYRALGVALFDTNGKARNQLDIWSDLNGVFNTMDPARAAAFGANMGIPPKVMNLLLQTPDAYRKIIAEQERLKYATEADAKAAHARQQAWNNFITTATNLGRQILTVLTPALNQVTSLLTEIGIWFNEHPAAIEAAFTGITVLVGLLSAAITKSLIATALEPLIGTFKVLASVGRFALGTEVAAGATEAAVAVGGIGTGLAALGTGLAILTGIGAAIAAIGAAAYEIYEHWEGIKSFFGFGGGEKGTGGAGHTTVHKSAAGGYATLGNAPAAGKSDLDTLMGFGWSRDQAIGILANVQRESSGNISAVGDRGAAYGLAQWHPDRQADFAKWAGHDIRSSTREEQLGFINYELTQGSRKRAGDALRASSGAQSAAQVVSRLYEAPANANREASTRASIAAAMASLPQSTLALAGAGANAGASYDQRSNNIRSDVRVGQVIVNTQATDAAGIAGDIRPAIQRQAWTSNIESGPS